MSSLIDTAVTIPAAVPLPPPEFLSPPGTLLVFGLFLLFGVFGGMMANRVKWMPTITAYMLLDLLIGPHGLGLITKEMMLHSTGLIDVALGLILYKLGNMLHPWAMVRSTRLLATSLVEISCTFLLVCATMLLFGYDGVVAALVGAIAISSSPAVLVHVADEMGADGPVTERAKSLVVLNNLVSFIIFSLAMPFALQEQDAAGYSIAAPILRLFAEAGIGIAVAWAAVRMTRGMQPGDRHYRFAVIIGAVMLSVGLSEMIGASLLFSSLVLGVATRWFETSKHNLSKISIGEGGDLFFIILFVMAGAKIDLVGLWSAGLVIAALVALRLAGKMCSMLPSVTYAKFSPRQSLAIGMLVTPMAGMAIGLAVTTNELVPEIGAQVSALIFAMVAVFEGIGPFMAARAFDMSEETGKLVEETD